MCPCLDRCEDKIYYFVYLNLIKMAGVIKRAFWDAPEGQIHYRYILATAAEKKAPVVFLHQSASCGWAYQSMMKAYATRGHDCYAPDMPG